jgi:hypothetical protein
MLGLSLNFGIWIKDAGWPPECGTPNNDNAEIQSSLWARDSSKQKDRILEGILREKCSQNQSGFVTCCFYENEISLFSLLTETI